MREKPANIVYVTIDSIRADRVGFLGYERPTTPNLDGLADGGTVCTTAIADGIPTYYSFKSLLGGLHSLSHARGAGLPDETKSLAEAFDEAGYATAGFNAGNPWLTRNYGYDRGFEVFRDFLTDDESSEVSDLLGTAQSLLTGNELLRDKLGSLARMALAVTGRTPLEPAERVTDVVKKWLEHYAGSEQPFFLWIHYMDPHYPWVPRGEDLRRLGLRPISDFEKGRIWHKVSYHNGETDARTGVSLVERTQIDDLYDAEVRRTDEAVGRLIETLHSLDYYEETLFAVAGDHGTQLYDHGSFSHGPRALYDEVVRVPVLLSGPGIDETTIRRPTSLVDVPTTLLTESGADVLDQTMTTFEGSSIYDSNDDPVFSEVVYEYDPVSDQYVDNGLLLACYDWPWKLVWNREHQTVELYDLESDPDERDDRAVEEPETVERLLAEIQTHRDGIERQNRTIDERRHIRTRLAELERAGKL
ncbi:sulfatase [Haladaptatus sp. NG-SE-30]